MSDIVVDDKYIKLIDENNIFKEIVIKKKVDELSDIIEYVLPNLKALALKYDSIFATRLLEFSELESKINEGKVKEYIEKYKYHYPIKLSSPSNFSIWVSITNLLHEICFTYQEFAGTNVSGAIITEDLKDKIKDAKDSLNSLVSYVYQAISSNSYEKNLIDFNFDLATKLEFTSSYFHAMRRTPDDKTGYEDCMKPYEEFEFAKEIAFNPRKHIKKAYLDEIVDTDDLKMLISFLSEEKERYSIISPEEKKIFVCACEALIIFNYLINYIYVSTSEAQEFMLDFFYKVVNDSQYDLKPDTPEEKGNGFIDDSNFPHSAKELDSLRGMFDVASDLDSVDDSDAPVMKMRSVECCGAMISLEAEGMDFGRSQLNALNRMVEKNKFNRYQNNLLNTNKMIYKKKANKFQKILSYVTKVRPKIDNINRDAKFFKQWYGRIPTMYKFYAQEAKVTENRMRGDPTQILSKNGADYLVNLVNYSNTVFNDLVVLAKRIATTGAIPARMNIIKGFCKEFPIQDTNDPEAVKNAIKQETSYRIAQAILQDNEVYGFSAEGMAMNGKFPDANHIITSLFIENSHEKPSELSVSEIFQSPESLSAFAFPERVGQFTQLYQKALSLTQSNFDDKVLASVADTLDNTMKNAINQMKRNGADYYKDSGNLEIKGAINMLKGMNAGIKDSIDILIEQKTRCVQACSAMYSMVTRVANLAKRCVAALHQVEVQHGDSTYKASGINSFALNKSVASYNMQNQRNMQPQQGY